MDKITLVLGADIGGSHISTALINLHNREVLKDSFRRKKVNPDGSAEEILNDWAVTMNESLAFCSTSKKVGIAMPGPFDYDEGISLIKDLGKFDCLYGLNIKQLLAAKLNVHQTNILLKNDAGCFLQGEVFSGAARGYDSAIGITLGTGFGSAMSKNGIAEDASLWSYPFNNGIAEDHFSTKWFVKRYVELSGRPIRDVKELMDGIEYDIHAQQVFGEFSQNLAVFLTSILREYPQEVIVFGGNISHAYKLFSPHLKAHFVEKNIKVVLHKSMLDEEAALIGAASLWYDKSEEPSLNHGNAKANI